jgi:DNA-binding CsgD family transcriptional regulator
MSLLSRMKQRLGIQVEPKTNTIPTEIEPIHRPSFSIGDSLGDIKVGLMDLKIRSERIEGSMLSREYFEQSIGSRDKTDLMICKLDETLRGLAEFQPRKPSIEPSGSSSEPRTPSSTEEAEGRLEKPEVSLRLRQVFDVFQTRQKTTPKQLARLLGIATNTACEHLRNLERLGHVRRVNRGLYELVR